ncbi:PREDICTED: uncharacterized protein LOC104294541 [Charadrius vociferus]|uniref:uncharacterized protein LOC104294541 n=1 Tax=Charadrius vociferus TaxID=50402 RepID=UPI0005219102|nr:PREDICTED: uncharacterized protein LOC104294541 [Charadrius vociferus]
MACCCALLLKGWDYHVGLGLDCFQARASPGAQHHTLTYLQQQLENLDAFLCVLGVGNVCDKSMCYTIRTSVMFLQAISKGDDQNLVSVSPVGATKFLNSPVTLPEMASEEVTYADLRFTTLEKSQDQEFQTARAKGVGNVCDKSMCYTIRTSVMFLQAISKGDDQNLVSVSPVGATKFLNSPVTLPEMASEEVTYADLRFTTLEKSQDREFQTARAKDSPSPSSCWRLATVVLGVFCLSSVVAAGVLAARFNLVCHLVRERDENFTLQKAIVESLNQQLELLQAQNLNLSETVKQLATSRGHKCIPCPENWLQYGDDCYYFSKEWKTWQESKAQCSGLESRLLKIESKEELMKQQIKHSQKSSSL